MTPHLHRSSSVNPAQSDVSLVESELRSRAVSRIDEYDGYSEVIAVFDFADDRFGLSANVVQTMHGTAHFPHDLRKRSQNCARGL